MISKFIKIFFILMIFFFAKQANSKVTNNDLNENELTNYLSAIISYDNQQNQASLSYFNSSKALVKKRDNYLRKYIFSLAINQKVKNYLLIFLNVEKQASMTQKVRSK